MRKSTTRTLCSLAFLLSLTARAGVEDEVQATDDVIVGVVAERVTLDITGLKDLPAGEIGSRTLATWRISTSAAAGQLALTFGPTNSPSLDGEFHGVIRNPQGDVLKVKPVCDGPSKPRIQEDATGVPWLVFAEGRQLSGTIQQAGQGQKAQTGAYPLMLQAALYRD